MEVTSLFNFWGGEIRNHLKSLEHPLHWLWDLGRERGAVWKKGGQEPSPQGQLANKEEDRKSRLEAKCCFWPSGDCPSWHGWHSPVSTEYARQCWTASSLSAQGAPLPPGGYKPGTLPSCHPYCNYDCSPDLSTLSEQSEPCLTKNRLQKYI